MVVLWALPRSTASLSLGLFLQWQQMAQRKQETTRMLMG